MDKADVTMSAADPTLQRKSGWVKRATSSAFVRGVAVLSSGQALATGIQILAAPILGRLYRPEEYGVLGAYMAVSSVLAGIGNWQYAQGVVVERRENSAYVLVRLCMITSGITAIVATVIALCIFLYPSVHFHAERIWFLLLPVSTFVGGMNAAWSALANRLKKYRMMASIQVISMSLGIATSLGFGFAGFGYAGLLYAFLGWQIASFLLFAVFYFRLSERKKYRIPQLRLWAMARKHRNFAFFSTPSAFVGGFAMQLPIYALGLQGSTEMIGLFSRARQLLSMPITLLGNAIAQVFQQRASADYAANGNCKQVFTKTFVMLIGLSVIPTFALAMAAPWLFEKFLGSNWRAAGEVARVLSPMLLLRMVCNPLSTVFFVTGAQREGFLLSLFSAAVTFMAIAVPFAFSLKPIWIVVGFSVAYCLTYSIYLYRSYLLSK